MATMSLLPGESGRNSVAHVHVLRRVPPGALAACGIAAISLAAALVAGSVPHLPFALDRCDAVTIGLAFAIGLTTLVWPELALPAIVIAAGLLDFQFGGERVRHLVFVKLALFACSGLGVVFAGITRPSRFVRVRTPGDAPALCLVCYTAASAAYGYLGAGYELDPVAVASYHLSQLALYHFLVTTTLSRPDSFRRAGTIIIAWSLLCIVTSLMTPGRGGGTASTWLIVLLCYTAAGRTWWAGLAWAAMPFALLDTLTSGYRTLWVSVAAQVGWLASRVFGLRIHRLRATAAALLILCALSAATVLAAPSLLSPLPAAETLHRFGASLTDAGYRLPEALVGLAAFRESIVFGRGVGYHTAPLWIETMGYMPVGPIYHVYYVSYLSNEGIVGLAIVLWYFLAVLFSRQTRRMRQQASERRWAAAGIGLQAAFFGAVVGAFASGPSDGHWTWGVLGAGTLLCAVWTSQRLTHSCRRASGTELTVETGPGSEGTPGVRAYHGAN